MLVYPDLVGARRLALAARRGQAPRRRPAGARRLRARHGVRGRARLQPRRRRAPDQLARDRAAGAADVEPVPHRPGSGGALPARRRPPERRRRARTARCSTSRSTGSWPCARPRTRSATAAARSPSPIACCATSRPRAWAPRPSRARSSTSSRSTPTATTSSRSARIAGGKRGFVLVLADLVDEAAARALVSAVPVLARRHAVCVASVRDDALDEHPAAPAGRAARCLRDDASRSRCGAARALAARRVARRRRDRRGGPARALRGGLRHARTRRAKARGRA